MSTTEYLPVTKEQAVETQINQSVKISKQLMKTELKKRMAETLEQYKEASSLVDGLITNFRGLFEANAKRQVELGLQNDSEITRFRNLYNRFSACGGPEDTEFPAFNTNLKLLHSFNVEGLLIALTLQRGKTHKKYREALLEGICEIEVSLNIPDRHIEDHYQNLLGYKQPVGISLEIIDAFLVLEAQQAKATEYNEQYNAIALKLNDIDAVAEDMEARLLVQELSKSEQGKEALSIAGSLVGDMLGDVPALLTIDK